MNGAEIAAAAGAGALWPYPAAFIVLVLAGIGLPIPEELTFLTAGIVTQQTGGVWWIMALSVIAGVLVGDILCYFAGRKWGYALLQKRPFNKVIKPRHLSRVQGFFDEHGPKAVFFGSLVAGLRAPTFFMAGATGVRFLYFVAIDATRAIITGGGSVWLAYTIGDAAHEWIAERKGTVFTVLGVVAVLIVIWEVRRHRKNAAALADELEIDLQPPDDLNMKG